MYRAAHEHMHLVKVEFQFIKCISNVPLLCYTYRLYWFGIWLFLCFNCCGLAGGWLCTINEIFHLGSHVTEDTRCMGLSIENSGY